jgi:putative peptidoglycan lipid II flippase
MPVATDDAETSQLPLGKLAAVTACSFLQLVLQFLLVVWLARRFGTSPTMDAFQSAFSIPLAVTGVLVGPLPLVLVPELVRLQSGPAAIFRWRLAVRVLLLAVGLGVLLAGIAVAFGGAICAVVFAGFDEPRLQASALALSWLAWLIPLNATVALLQAAHHSEHRYILPAVSNVVGVALSLGWIIAATDELDLATLCAALVAGSALASLVLFVPLAGPLAGGMAGQWRGIGLWRFSVLAAPLFVSAAYARLDPLVDRSIASFLDEGSIAELGYAQRVTTALATLTASGLSVVIFPKLASVSDDPRDPRLADLLATAWRFLTVLLVPCVAAIAVFNREIVADLFQRDAFGSEATVAVARLLTILLGVLVAGSLGEIAGKALYAMAETRLPAVIAVVGFTIGIGLKWALSRRLGVEGVALGTTLYYLLCFAALLVSLHRRVGGQMFRGLPQSAWHAVAGSVVALAVGFVPVATMEDGGAFVGGAAGLIAYVASLRLLGNEFLVRTTRR